MSKMKRLHIKFIKWLSNKFGYKIIMLKAKNGTTTIEGDREVLPYVDISGYFFKKEPLKRFGKDTGDDGDLDGYLDEGW